MREYVELNCLEEDGRLYHNNLLDTIEALIPNQFDSVHAADLLELPDGDLLACWFAGSDEGNADISIAVSRLKAGESRWSVGEIVSDDPSRSEQNPSLFLTPGGEIWLMYTAQTSRTPDDNPNFNLQYTAEIRRKISKDNGYTWGPTETMFSRPVPSAVRKYRFYLMEDGCLETGSAFRMSRETAVISLWCRFQMMRERHGGRQRFQTVPAVYMPI